MTKPLNAAMSKPMEGGPSFPLRHRLYRAVWNVTWFLLASWTPPQFRSWRNFLLRIFGAKIHSSANVYASVKIWYPLNLTMGSYASLGPDVICYSMDKVYIGARTVISQRAHLCGGTHDIEDRNFKLRTLPIFISSDCWIAAEAFVGPGVRVEEGAVLGARGVTVKDLESWTVYAGNPAQAIRPRMHMKDFDE